MLQMLDPEGRKYVKIKEIPKRKKRSYNLMVIIFINLQTIIFLLINAFLISL